MNTQWAIALLDAMAADGVRHAIICPGSRSTPLALAAHAHPDLQVHVGIDERSAGFFALGIGKASGRPGVVITTSGTAVANLLPAVIEAHQANVPLLLLTADRPDGVRDTGANQTIDQVGIFASYVRSDVDMQTPDDQTTIARATARRAVATAMAWPPGPVHINQPFHKPLEPDAQGQASLDALAATKERPVPATPSPISWGRAPGVDPTRLGAKGLIIVGPGDHAHLAGAMTSLAQSLGVPILADCLSGLRFHSTDTIDGFDAFMDAPEVFGMRPDWIIQFGAAPTSASLGRALAAWHDVPRYRIEYSGRGWNDVPGDVQMIDCSPDRFIQSLMDEVDPSPDPHWQQRWQALDALAARVVQSELAGRWGDIESGWVPVIAGHARHLFVGNSMPIRDVERMGRGSEKRVFANRGASGIDGTIATAAGIATIVGPTVAVIGDVACQHDVGSLAWLPPDLHLVVIENGGGRIFHHLPVASVAPFESLFLTPPGMDIIQAARAFGRTATRTTPTHITTALHEAQVVVVRVPGAPSVTWRQRVRAQIHAQASSVLAAQAS